MKVLVATDGSPCSDGVIAEVARLPWPPHSQIHVITVDARVDPGLLKGSSPTVFDELIRQQRIESTRRVRDAAAALVGSAPGLNVTSAVVDGWPKDAIVSEAERWGADLVVVGSHGYGPVRRFFLGSVSLFVAHHAPCSVLVVRPPPAICPAEPLDSNQ
jgi:nucleotide-binding universal stress UspA family protein